MQLKDIGFFRDLPHGLEDSPSLEEARRSSGDDDEAQVISYLRDGNLMVATTGPGLDPLAEGLEYTDPPHILTDGVWMWPGDLAFYVEKYHVSLEQEFLDHIRKNCYRVPVVLEHDLHI